MFESGLYSRSCRLNFSRMKWKNFQSEIIYLIDDVYDDVRFSLSFQGSKTVYFFMVLRNSLTVTLELMIRSKLIRFWGLSHILYLAIFPQSSKTECKKTNLRNSLYVGVTRLLLSLKDISITIGIHIIRDLHQCTKFILM